jgi:uncharacterized protein
MEVNDTTNNKVYVGYGDETAKVYMASKANVQVGYGILLVEQTHIAQVQNDLAQLKKQFNFADKELHASKIFHPKMRIKTYGSKVTEAAIFSFTNQIIDAVKNISIMLFCTGTVKKGQHKRTQSYMEHISGNIDKRIPIEFPPLNTKHYSRFCLQGLSIILVKYNVKEVILDPERTKVENIIVDGKGKKHLPSEAFLEKNYFDDGGVVKEINLRTIKREDINLHPLLQLADLFSYLCVQFHTVEPTANRRIFIPFYEKLQPKISIFDFDKMACKRIM